MSPKQPVWRRGQNAGLFCVCGKKSQFPEETLPEIAFVGRSNVGKSTLINTLLGRKGAGKNALARTSSVPGKTRTINWYAIDDLLYFVDLPGYGYAKISKQEQAKWGQVIESYLKERRSLKVICLLVDIRHEPSADDKMMMDWLRYYQVPTIIVATKADKVTRNQLPHQKKVLANALGIPSASVYPFSGLNGQGKEELWKALEEKTIFAEASSKAANAAAPEDDISSGA
ncbi:MAG: YihA family ribosome biogenesis GTP-binding protein [Firmicutes bacterium]|nr:YihA family ribosome biogenesis GTP-binding protein [Bacillota bacterium]